MYCSLTEWIPFGDFPKMCESRRCKRFEGQLYTLRWASLFMCVLFQDGVMQPINESLSPCALPGLVQHAYRMGGPVSSLSYSLPLQVLQPRRVTCRTSHIHMKSPVEDFYMNNATVVSEPPKMIFYPPQAPLFSGCEDSGSWGPSVLCCHQRRALSSRFIHIQRQDQTVCKQTEGDLQQGEVQWWEVALGQWTHITLITCIENCYHGITHSTL